MSEAWAGRDGAISPRLGAMERVLVIGSGGAGKSTFASELAARLQLPLIHLDARFWSAGWKPSDKTEWRRVVDELIAAPRWVMDGNYGGTLEPRLARCDTVIFLDLPRVVCLWRAFKRSVRNYGRTRADLAPGCREQLPSWEFMTWIWTYPARRRPGILERLRELRPDQRAIVLSSSAKVRHFLGEVRAMQPVIGSMPGEP